jgi:hypothetical protein
MRRAFGLAVVAVAAVVSVSPAQVQPAKLPAYDRKLAVVLDDDAHLLLQHLNNDFDGSQQTANVASEDVDVYAGASCMKVSALQRHSRQIPGWTFKIVEKPAADNEFRYIRFAWKKVGGEGIMIQLHDPNRSWVARYYAGKNVQGWNPAKEVSKDLPKEWTVVTRDLWEDVGKQYGGMTVSGISFTAVDGQHALFDQVMFGRSVAELDAVTDAAVGKPQAGGTLEPKYREALWEDLFDKDRAKSGPAVRGLLAGAAEVVPMMADRLPKTTQSADEVKNRAKKISTYIAQLSSDTDFDTRLAAEEALDKLGPAAEPAVRTALTSADPEVRYRAGRLMKRLKGEESEAALAMKVAGRMVRILERANTPEAKDLLKRMSDGEYGPEYLDPAVAALGRTK